MFRRPHLFQPNPLTADQLATLVAANQLMAEGLPLEAGPLFAGVAEDMQHSNHPRRAANLYARAAHAFADGKNEQAALDCSCSALALFIQSRMARRAAVFYANITRRMVAKGMQAAAEALRREYGAQITAAPAGQKPRRRRLPPTTCPKCGAPVHGDEANWVDDNTIECEYCGALIRSE